MAELPEQFQNGPVLIIKQGPKEGEIGDCPFSQYANMALRARGVKFTVFLMNLNMKPDWFKLVNPKQTTPTFVVGKLYHTSSDAIVELADQVGTKGSKLYGKQNVQWEKASDAIKPFFGTFVAHMKSKDPKQDIITKSKLDESCTAISEHLKQVHGKFIVSDNLSALDCNLAPKMHALLVAGKHFKKYELPSTCTAIKTYMKSIYETEEWKVTSCSDETVIWGWSKLFASSASGS